MYATEEECDFNEKESIVKTEKVAQKATSAAAAIPPNGEASVSDERAPDASPLKEELNIDSGNCDYQSVRDKRKAYYSSKKDEEKNDGDQASI